MNDENKCTEPQKVKSEWPGLIIRLVATFLVTYILLGCILGIGVVRGISMNPNFTEGDFWIISRVGYTLDHGDVVIIKYDGEYDTLIKRVVGLPGDEITYSVDGLAVYRNGELLVEDYIADTDELPSGIFETVVVEDGYIFVMGDNRLHSMDSRSLGLISMDDVVGEYLFTLIDR